MFTFRKSQKAKKPKKVVNKAPAKSVPKTRPDVKHDNETWSEHYARIAGKEGKQKRENWVAFEALIKRLSFSGMWNPQDHAKFPEQDRLAVLAILSLVRYDPVAEDMVHPGCALAELPCEIVMEILGAAFAGSTAVEKTTAFCVNCRQTLDEQTFTSIATCYAHDPMCTAKPPLRQTSKCLTGCGTAPHQKRKKTHVDAVVPACNPEIDPDKRPVWNEFAAEVERQVLLSDLVSENADTSFKLFIVGNTSGLPWAGSDDITFTPIDKCVTESHVIINHVKMFCTLHPTDTCVFATAGMHKVAVDKCRTCFVVVYSAETWVTGYSVELAVRMGALLRASGY